MEWQYITLVKSLITLAPGDSAQNSLIFKVIMAIVKRWLPTQTFPITKPEV